MTQPVPLACSVRDCGRPLTRTDNRYVCPERHSYDIARSGYINLLQPQDRRSLAAGDARDAVEARVRLLAAGVGRALIDAVAATVRGVRLPPSRTLRRTAVASAEAGPPDLAAPVVLDLGSGAGDALAAIVEKAHGSAVGIDLSAAAADFSARRYPAITWVVANADRRLPILDSSVDLVLSLHGRRNPDECLRMLRDTGSLIVAVPAADDLVELRARVQGDTVTRDRGEAVLNAHAAGFEIVERTVARERLTLDRDTMLDLLRTTYRGARSSEKANVDALDAMTVTCASEIFVFRKRAAIAPERPT